MEFDVGQLQRLLIRGLTGDGQASVVEVVEGWRCAEMHIKQETVIVTKRACFKDVVFLTEIWLNFVIFSRKKGVF